MKKLSNSFFILFLSCLFLLNTKGIVSAQEGEPIWPIYVVQSGDILSSIANRFNVTIDSIVQENGIVNANQLFVGTELYIPGITWASGFLVDGEILLGENYLSLKRSYGYSDSTMMHLGEIISPNQLSVGYPFLFATGQGENLDQKRIATTDMDDIISISLINQSNPWKIVAQNSLAGKWMVQPNDILRIPHIYSTGPGALPSIVDQLKVEKGNFIQGKTTTIRISVSTDNSEFFGTFMGQEIKFFKMEDGSYISLFGIHVLAEPGRYPLVIEGKDNNGDGFSFSQMVIVREGGYGFETITVDAAYLEDLSVNAETEYIDNIISQYSNEKFWQGYFIAPTIYYEKINSFFGTRRSFNGSPFIYYHGGLDFGGGTGVEILAPAGGTVVFASPLDIRGNATIINHGWGIFSGYFHQSEIFVSPGDIVSPGEVIGLVGNTGRSSGAHLHWEIWAGGIQVDPYEWLSQPFP